MACGWNPAEAGGKAASWGGESALSLWSEAVIRNRDSHFFLCGFEVWGQRVWAPETPRAAMESSVCWDPGDTGGTLGSPWGSCPPLPTGCGPLGQ